MSSIENVSIHTFTWKINRFSLCSNVRDEPLRSPIFKAKALSKTVWYILFYPQGIALQEAESYTSCFLCRDRDLFKDSIYCIFSIEIIDENGQELFSKAMEGEFETGDFIGWNMYKEIDQIKDECICLPSDILIFRCRMELESSEKATISENNAETTIGSDRMTFIWNIENSSSCYRTFRFHCPGGSEYEISLHIPQDEVVVTIEKLEKDDNNFKATFKMSLVDVNGVESLLRMFEHVFKEGTEYWSISTSIEKTDLMTEGPEYIKDGVLTVKCEFCTENWSEAYITYENLSERSAKHLLALKKDRTDPLASLQEDLKRLYISSKKSDIILRAEGEKLPAHKIILSARSSVFASMFQKRPQRYIDFPSVEAKVLRIFVEYLYTGILRNINYEINRKLFRLADKYQVESLKEKCYHFAKKE